MSNKKRRLFSSLLTVFSILVVAVACGDDDGDDGSSGRFGGEIVVHALEFSSFDPHFSAFSQDLMHEKQVFRGLYQLDVDSMPVPEMAVDFPVISDDLLTYTIKLKEGLVWSDGEPLTAHDFELGIQRTCSYAVAGAYSYLLSNIVGCDEFYDPSNAEKSESEVAALLEGVLVTALDDRTLEITLEQPQPTFTTILTLWTSWPVPSHIVTDPSAEWPRPTDLVFNGPFEVESYSPGESMVFVRNDNYGGDHLAYLDRLTFRYIEDSAVANNAFRSGELAIAKADISNFAGLQDEFPDELLVVDAAVTSGLLMQMASPPLDNLDVRLALARAIDREQLNKHVFQDANTATTTWIPADIVGIDGGFEDVIGFDAEAARIHLAKAGFEGGEGFPEITLLIMENHQLTAEFLQDQFSQILNISIRIDVVDGPTFGARFGAGDYDLFPITWAHDYPDPESWVVGLFNTDGGLNFAGCSLPEIDATIAAAQFNTNDEKRREQYRHVNELVIENVCGVAPMFHPANSYLVAANVGGAREFSTSSDLLMPGDWIAEEWYLRD